MNEKPVRQMEELAKPVLTKERTVSFLWLVPLAAAVFAGWLGYTTWQERGYLVHVRFSEGHGLKVGDPVRYRGIHVGGVTEISLSSQLESVTVSLRLLPEAAPLARANTRFWIVRPELGLSKVGGLETLVGPRYVAVLPGNRQGNRRRSFEGLSRGPVILSRNPGDLEVILEAPRRGTIQVGAPVRYRQIPVGTVLSVGLASDGSQVEARVHIESRFSELIRENTVFWPSGGLRADVRLSGVEIELESLKELLLGGVSLATPPLLQSGSLVLTGHRFQLAPTSPEKWEEWDPGVALGSELLPPGRSLPSPVRATLNWKQGLIFVGSKERSGWLLATENGLLGPADLLTPPEKARDNSATLTVAGKRYELTQNPTWSRGGLALFPLELENIPRWRTQEIRTGPEPEDCIAVSDPKSPPMPLAASRLTALSGGLTLDPAVSVDPTWHGASVLSRADGKLVGFLLVSDEERRVATLTDLK